MVLFGTALGFAQENFTLASESTVTVDGTSTLHDWTVTANTMNGSLKSEGNVFQEISFVVEAGSLISTRGATMDKKTHNALKKDEHPKITFSANDVTFSEGDNQSIFR